MAKVDLEEAVGTHDAVLLSFGSSYCGPCMLEWPMLRDVAAEYERHGLLVIFVLLDSEPHRIEAMKEVFTKQLGISSPVIVDRDGALATRYRVNQLPQLYLIDDRGEVVWREIGYKGSTLGELTQRLEVLLVD